ncbi:MAG: LysM peptidoglycan-binding domain-containing protein [Desulfobulbaceae bacterium]|nr:LysM peptidoglycan-binding domain-containing protein [Desulfobulbaceae bacterium]
MQNHRSFLRSLVLLLFCLSPFNLFASQSGELFPVFDSIKANVVFWEKVYAKYPTTKGIIHDNRNLGIIYEVIDLVPQDRAGSRRINKKRVKKVKAKYKKILLSFAAGGQAKTKEEKKTMALFGANPSASQFRKAADSIRFQLCQKDRFFRGVVRSGAYLEEIKKIFKRNGLPEDLSYLPHVESSFNYKAYSKFGAAGIWQFTRSTGKRFMTIDYVLDERRDPIRATHAAARYLKENYSKLGSWPLAITAYNHGANGMMRAKKKIGGYEKILKEYDGRSFGFASRNFYSEFIAARNVAKNHKKYFGDVKLDKPVAVYEVAMPGFAPVKDLSRHFQVDLATLADLNPGLRSPVFEGRKYVPKDYKLRLPANNGHMTKLAAAMPGEIFAAQQKRSRFYRVQKGDTAGAIARQQRVKLQDLLLANGLDRRATIYAGQNLRIPSVEEKVVLLAKAKTTRSDVTAPAAMEKPQIIKEKPVAAPVRVEKEKEEKPEKVVEVAEVAEVAEPAQKEEPVEKTIGELEEERVVSSSWEERVARVTEKLSSEETETTEEAAVPVEAVLAKAEIESTEPEKQAEQEVLEELSLASLAGTEVDPSVVVGDLLVDNIVTKNGHTTGTIRVEVGETLGHFADWLQVPTRSIRRLNGLRFGRAIKLGQRLKIKFGKVKKEDFEEKRYEYHKEIEEDFFAAYKIEGARLYRIQPGDNIWSLCHEEFDLPFWLIRKFNSAHDFNNLKLDELLIVPVVVGRVNEN